MRFGICAGEEVAAHAVDAMNVAVFKREDSGGAEGSAPPRRQVGGGEGGGESMSEQLAAVRRERQADQA